MSNDTFIGNKANAEAGYAALKAFREETKKPMELTEKLLLGLIADNKDTVYGKKYGFADIHSIEDYQKKVPVITYDDIAEYLDRMKNGEKNVLTAYPFNHMNETSGTIGAPKVIPMTDKQSAVFARYNNLVSYGLFCENLDDDWMNGRENSISDLYRT